MIMRYYKQATNTTTTLVNAYISRIGGLLKSRQKIKRIKQFCQFVIKRRLMKKQFWFVKRVKRQIFFTFIDFIKQTFKINFVVFLLKKYYFNYFFNKKIIKRLVRNYLKIVRINRFIINTKSFYCRLVKKNQSLKLLTNSLKNCQLVFSSNVNILLNGFLTYRYLKKNYFRTKLKLSKLSVFRLTKLSSIFAKKGNNNCLLIKLFIEMIFRRRNFFRGLYQFFRNTILPLKVRKIFLTFNGKIFNNSSMRTIDNNNSTTFFNYSVLLRKLVGIFYKFIFRRLNNKVIFNKNKLYSFKLFRIKSMIAVSSFRLLESVLRLFYLSVDIRSWKKSGRSVIVPIPIRSKIRRLFLFNHWIKFFVLNNRSEGTISKKVFGEFSELIRRKGLSIKKLNVMRKTIRANRALIRKSRISLL